MTTERSARAWLDPALAGMGPTSFFSDLGHQVATAILPLFLDGLGAAGTARPVASAPAGRRQAAA